MHLHICKYMCLCFETTMEWFEILSFILCVQGSVRGTATPTLRPTPTPDVYTAAQWWTPTAWSSMAAVWGKYLVSLVSNGYFSLNIKYKKQKSSAFYNVLVFGDIWGKDFFKPRFIAHLSLHKTRNKQQCSMHNTSPSIYYCKSTGMLYMSINWLITIWLHAGMNHCLQYTLILSAKYINPPKLLKTCYYFSLKI